MSQSPSHSPNEATIDATAETNQSAACSALVKPAEPDNQSALIRDFVKRFKLGAAFRSGTFWKPVWLCVVTDPVSEATFARLRQRSKQFVIVSPLGPAQNQAAIPLDVATHAAIARHAHQYGIRILLSLFWRTGRIAGIVVGQDRAPWVRHLVYACKELRLCTVLLPSQKLSPEEPSFEIRPKNAQELLARRPWTVASQYSEPNIVGDSPVTDHVLVEGTAEQSAYVALGYPEERVIDVRVPVRSQPGGTNDASLASCNVHDAQVEATLMRLCPRRTLLGLRRTQPFFPGDPSRLFSGKVEQRPRAGVVAYHREIDQSDVYVPAMLGYRRMMSPRGSQEAQAADVFAFWGGTQGEQRKLHLKRWAFRFRKPVLRLEDGLFRSVDIGLSGTPSVSIMVDDRGPYYDATATNHLERLLASRQVFGSDALTYARDCIDRIGKLRLSKYNHAPDRPLPYSPGSVLLVDQRMGDLSVSKGLACEDSFREMLAVACRENPQSQILVKRHPDALSGKKTSYFCDESLTRWGRAPNVHLVDYETNPHALFDCCSKVYVVTSGMGFEALMRGLEVHCFGMPFYAGWGLTIDRKWCWRRRRKRTLDEVFYAACILQSRYYDPINQRPCSIQETIEYLAKTRDERFANGGSA